jgi:hypothetical protein
LPFPATIVIYNINNVNTISDQFDVILMDEKYAVGWHFFGGPHSPPCARQR